MTPRKDEDMWFVGVVVTHRIVSPKSSVQSRHEPTLQCTKPPRWCRVGNANLCKKKIIETCLESGTLSGFRQGVGNIHMGKIYSCECGKTFTTSQQVNGHKSHCKIHMSFIGREEDLEKAEQKRKDSISKYMRESAIKRKEEREQKESEELNKWIEERHRCKKCGKVMVQFFGTGVFCSRQCSNSHEHGEESRKKASDSAKNFYSVPSNLDIMRTAGIIRRKRNEEEYYKNPSICKVCGKLMPYERRNHKTCSTECYKKSSGGFREGSAKNYKYGTYKGIYCDSSWELAFIVYNMDNNVDIQRNTDYFFYTYMGKEHKYYPDFIIGNTYIEIKNYWTEQVQAKIDCFPKDKKCVILFPKDITPYIEYCRAKYGYKYWETLYD